MFLFLCHFFVCLTFNSFDAFIMSLVPLPKTLKPALESYLPRSLDRTFVTLTYAQSLDSRIASKPGVQTKISHLETKTMTHYIRSNHDAILVGIGTVLADDPKLNCRYTGGKSPVPVVLDPKGQWDYTSSQLRNVCDEGEGRAPVILLDDQYEMDVESKSVLLEQGGACVQLPLLGKRNNNWGLILDKLYELGIKSLMVEGGATVINDLLVYKREDESVIDSLIVTIGPVFLGKNGVQVSPSNHLDLKNVSWWTGVQDSVLFATTE